MSWAQVSATIWRNTVTNWLLQQDPGTGLWSFRFSQNGSSVILGVDDIIAILTSATFATSPLLAVAPKYSRLEMRRATTINNGASGALAYTVQPLNTISVDGVGITLSANKFLLPALPAGYTRFRCRATAPAYRSGLHQLTILNVTDGVTRYAGTSEANDSTTVTQTRSGVVVELSASTEYRLEHWMQVANAVGLGQAANSGQDEVYAVVEIWMEP